MRTTRRFRLGRCSGARDDRWRILLLFLPVALFVYVARRQARAIEAMQLDHDVLYAFDLSLPDYDARLRRVFPRAWADDVDVRCVRVPAFFKEPVVGLRHAAGGPLEVLLLEPSTDISTIDRAHVGPRREARSLDPHDEVGGPDAGEGERQRGASADGVPLEAVEVVESVQPIDADAARIVMAARGADGGNGEPRSPNADTRLRRRVLLVRDSHS